MTPETEQDQPSIVIKTDVAVHVYPLAYFERLLRGEAVAPLPQDVFLTILGDWYAAAIAESVPLALHTA